MVKISRYSAQRRKFIREDLGEESQGVHIEPPDRSHYPKPRKWIIAAAAGAVLLWYIARFVLQLING